MSKPALRIGAGSWGTKDGRLLGYFEGDTIDRYRPRHFTVTRGADINATRVNKKGLVEKGRENDLIRSNDFTGADWTSPSATLTGGQPGYDGTNDATLISMTGQYGQATQIISKTLVQTLSVYVKANTLKWFRPYIGGLGAYAYFDLENGVTGAQNGLHSYMEDAGNGWWRCAFTFEGSITDVRLHPAKGNHDMTATSGGVFIQHAQLESGFSATPYIETGSKTNLINNSEEPVAGYWSVNGATITRGNDGDGFFNVGYDGTNDAWRLRSSNTSASNVNADVLDIAGKGEYTFSVYARAGSQKFLRMSLVENDENDAAFNSRVWVDLSKGVFTTVPSTAHIVSKDIQYVTDGWYRIYLTFDIPADHEVTKVALYVTQATNNNTSALNDDIYIQHPQLEKGSRPTVYSPTISRAGVLEDQPRIDYSDNKAQLLLERDGRNYIKYSEGSQSLGGYNNSATDEANIFNVPEYINPTGHKGGVVRVTNLLSDGGDRLYASASTTSGTKYNGSFYIKGEAGKKISFYTKRIQSGAAESVSTGTVVTNIDLTGDWQRVDQTITANSPSAAVFIVNRTSVDISTADEVYVWGWQLEEGEYATSYLPNYGTTAGSTRTFDKVTFNPSTETTYNTSAYTYILDVDIPNEVTGTSPLWTDATDIANDGGFQLRQPDGNNMGITIHTGSGYQAFHSTAKTGRFKIAMRYASGTVEVFFNGTKHSGSYNVTGWDQSTNEYRFQNASRDNYKVNEFSYYAKALTDAECISLTTI